MDSSDSSSFDTSLEIKLCITCDQAAVGIGPFCRAPLCDTHLNVDVADAFKLKEEVDKQLRAYSQGDDDDPAAIRDDASSIGQQFQEQLNELDEIRSLLLHYLDDFRAKLVDRAEAVRVCARDIDDVKSYKLELAEAEAAGDIAEMVNLAESMQASLPDLRADFEKAHQLVVESADMERRLQRLRKLQGLIVNADSTEVSREAEMNSRRAVFHPAVFSHEVKLNSPILFLDVCYDASGFVGDSSSRVVPKHSTTRRIGVTLPEPCIYARDRNTDDSLLVISLDGKAKFRCHCEIEWERYIHGFHCDKKQLFFALPDNLTITDLSGRLVRKICPKLEGSEEFRGIGASESSVFLPHGNKVTSIGKTTGQIEAMIALSQFPDADLGNMVTHQNCVLVTDWKHKRVHRLRIDTQQLVASYPNESSGAEQFGGTTDLAIDSEGRLYACDWGNHLVLAMSADDGSLLWTFGVKGESGNGYDRLNNPTCLAVVRGGQREQLVVADWWNHRFLVLNID